MELGILARYATVPPLESGTPPRSRNAHRMPSGDNSMPPEFDEQSAFPVYSESEFQKLESAADGNAVDILEELHKTSGPERSRAMRALRAIRAKVDRSREMDPWKTDDPALEARIRRILNIPLRAGNTPTFGDGGCLWASLAGEETPFGYRCTDEQNGDVRALLERDLRNCDLSNLYPEVEESFDIFWFGGERNEGEPERKRFRDMNGNDRTTVFDLFVKECTRKNAYMFAPLVRFIARSWGVPISLYQDHEDSGAGAWSYFDAKGNVCDRPIAGAKAIRFDLGSTHFERVEPPEPPIDQGLPSASTHSRVETASTQPFPAIQREFVQHPTLTSSTDLPRRNADRERGWWPKVRDWFADIFSFCGWGPQRG